MGHLLDGGGLFFAHLITAMLLKFIALVFLISPLSFGQDQNNDQENQQPKQSESYQGPSRRGGTKNFAPIPKISLGQCSNQAFNIAKEISTLNSDSVISSPKGLKEQALRLAQPLAYVVLLPDKTESWDIKLEYTTKLKAGTVVARQVFYEVIMRPFPNDFCEILDVKKTEKVDYFQNQ